MDLFQQSAEKRRVGQPLAERMRPQSLFMQEFIQLLSQYIENHLPGQEIDYQCFALTILSFIYMINLDHHLGRSYCFDHETGPKRFIDNLNLSLR